VASARAEVWEPEGALASEQASAPVAVSAPGTALGSELVRVRVRALMREPADR